MGLTLAEVTQSLAVEALVLEDTVTPADREASPYRYLPFTVPPGTGRITVRYTYEKGNVLDIGLVDPEIGPFPSRRGFRGWSGAARREFFVARHAATPGYVPGAIQPGTWRVVLGLHQVRPEGCRYRVEVGLDSGNDADVGVAGVARGNGTVDSGAQEATGRAVRPPRRPLDRERGWYLGDLHCHTHHSDAKGSPEDLVASARARGLDFVAVTDHNTSSHHPILEDLSGADLLLIPGEEVTTDRGHANVWGVVGWVDFRLTADGDAARLVEEVHARGGVLSINHPKEGGPDWLYPVPDGVDCLEAWQMLWPFRNRQALDRYDGLLREGRRITLVGGSDWHQPAGAGQPADEWLRVASPTTWLRLPQLSVAAILEALRHGAVFVSEGPEGPALELTVGGAGMGEEARLRPGERPVAEATVHGASGDRLRWVGSQGVVREVAVDADPFVDRWLVEQPTRFLRAEVVWNGGQEGDETPGPGRGDGFERIRALSNPVYVRSEA